MAITYVGGATAVSAGNVDVSVDLTALTGGSDSAAATGDLVIFAYNIADADNVDLNMACNTSGFDTNEIADLFGNGTQDANLGVYWKFMTATPDTAVVGEGSLGGNDTAIQAAVMVFRGVKAVADGGPFDVTATTATGTTVGDPVPASINTSGGSGIWTVIVGSNAHAANVDGTFTAPTGYTTDWLTVGNQDTADGIIGMGYNSAPSDPEAPGTITTATTATGWCAVTIALAPAPANLSLTVDPGDFDETGVAATLVAGRATTAATGSYSLTGVDATLLVAASGVSLVVDPGAIAETGVAASLQVGRALAGGAATGSIAETGVAAILAAGRSLAGGAGPGSFSETGVAATFSYERAIVASPAAIALTGVAATFVIEKQLMADPGVYSVAGVSATVIHHMILAEPGSFALTGIAATLVIPSVGGEMLPYRGRTAKYFYEGIGG